MTMTRTESQKESDTVEATDRYERACDFIANTPEALELAIFDYCDGKTLLAEIARVARSDCAEAGRMLADLAQRAIHDSARVVGNVKDEFKPAEQFFKPTRGPIDDIRSIADETRKAMNEMFNPGAVLDRMRKGGAL